MDMQDAILVARMRAEIEWVKFGYLTLLETLAPSLAPERREYLLARLRSNISELDHVVGNLPGEVQRAEGAVTFLAQVQKALVAPE